MMEMIVGHELVVTFTRNGEVVDRLYCGNGRLARRLVGAGAGPHHAKVPWLTPGEFGTWRPAYETARAAAHVQSTAR
jgi:hypothetical protein